MAMDSNIYRHHRSSIKKITEGMDQLQLQPNITRRKMGKLILENEDEDGIDFVVVTDDEDEDEDNDDDDINENETKDEEIKTMQKNISSEKRNRRLMGRLGMELISGVHLDTTKKENKLYIFSSPTVYKSSTSDSYVIFGEPLIVNEKRSEKLPHEQGVSKPVVRYIVVNEEEGVDEFGLNPLDIELVMTHTGLSKAKAAKALKVADNDIITAIMEHMNN